MVKPGWFERQRSDNKEVWTDKLKETHKKELTAVGAINKRNLSKLNSTKTETKEAQKKLK